MTPEPSAAKSNSTKRASAPVASKKRMHAWRNWSGAVSDASQLTAGPTTETAVKSLVIGAGGSGLKVKTVGAGHSFNDIATTDGLRLHFNDYTGLVSVNSETNVATFRAGTPILKIPELLKPHGLALANQGDFAAQTIAGAISTGTHGTGLQFTNLSGAVRSLRIVLADGSILYCDSRTHPELFTFGRIGIGALGIILEVGLQCVPAFRVAANEESAPVDEVLDTFVAQAREHDHYSFLWYPHSTAALVKRNRRLAEGEEVEGYMPQSAFSRFVDEALVQTWGRQVSATIGTMVPGIVPKVNQFTSSLMARKKFTDDSHQVFAQPHKVRFNEMEYAVPFEDGPEVVREIRRLIERRDWRVSFPIEVRTTAADDIPLSPAFERESTYISVHRYVREPHEEYFGAIEEVLLAAGGRPHWGKLHTLRAEELRELYPRFDEFVTLRNDLDPQRVFHNTYLDRVLGA
ncbi:D-arabinono-1,4-lactone oxidase [Gulosibacter bifidus]|uniref:D-arabinono-1,4-lactone oxidase n=1 Tax=Gulosibacter bifidus TaxID=272239 RepID=A0ABW5RMD0_9MICO|nr:D-arabinono-1,4-lactone oxidase [Gulosibacter bifidus]